MDKIVQPSQIYARALYPLRRGCALWVPEPNEDLPSEYCQMGVQIGDVGVLRDEGSFDFVFNVCRPSSDPVNQSGVPDGFQPLSWDGLTRTTSHVFPPGDLVLSTGAEKRELDIEASTRLLPAIPVGAGAGFSIKFARDRGAIIFPPNGVKGVNSRNLAVFREYAERHSASWYKFMNERLGMEVGNGSIYFITGFDKTDRWENAVYSNNCKEQKCEVIFNLGSLAGVDGCLRFSNSSFYGTFFRRRSPPDNATYNQALFIRGFRIPIPNKIRTFFGRSAVEVNSMSDSPWKDVFAKKGDHSPFDRRRSSSFGSRSLSDSSSSSSGSQETLGSTSDPLLDSGEEAGDILVYDDSDTGVEDDDSLIPMSKLYHPLNVVNDYILRSVQDDIDAVITHDEDWFALLNEEVRMHR